MSEQSEHGRSLLASIERDLAGEDPDLACLLARFDHRGRHVAPDRPRFAQGVGL